MEKTAEIKDDTFNVAPFACPKKWHLFWSRRTTIWPS